MNDSMEGPTEPLSGLSMETTIIDHDDHDDTVDSEIPSELPNDFMAVAEGSGFNTGMIGLAILEVESRQLCLMEFHDDKDYTKLINILSLCGPKTLFIPHQPGDERKDVLFANNLPDGRTIQHCDRVHFSDEVGMEKISHYSLTSMEIIKLEVVNKKFALAAAGALFTQALEREVDLEPNSLEVTFRGGATMLLDPITIKTLELLMNENGKSDLSLFGFLQFTKTVHGRRFLRDAIINPLLMQPAIQERHDAVEELVSNPLLLEGLSQFLKELQVDFNGVLSKILFTPKNPSETYYEGQLDCVVFIKHTLQLIPTLLETLAMATSSALKKIANNIDGRAVEEILMIIRDYVSEECVIYRGRLSYKNMKMFAVKAADNSRLELTRKVYKEKLEDMTEVINVLNSACNLVGKSQVRLVFSQSQGYHIEAPKSSFEDFIHPTFGKMIWGLREYGKEKYRFVYTELGPLNEKVRQLKKSLVLLSFERLRELLNELRKRVAPLHHLSTAFTHLDFLCSLAQAAKTYNLTRPIMTTSVSNIKNGVHPIILKMKHNHKHDLLPVANSTVLNSSNRLLLITGPNMSGKSCYIRQVALLHILAQMGSFVCAEANSKFRILDQIFTRIGMDDDIVTSTSTFTNEVRQLNYLTTKATNNSLVLIDELGRGTSAEAGVGLCVSVIEYLLQKDVWTLFATHFIDIVRLQQLYPFISSYTMNSKVHTVEGKKIIDFDYTMIPINSDDQFENYGVILAETSGFDSQVTNRAKQILSSGTLYKKEITTANSCLRAKYLLSLHLQKFQRAYEDPQISFVAVKDYLEGVKSTFNRNNEQFPKGHEKNLLK